MSKYLRSPDTAPTWKALRVTQVLLRGEASEPRRKVVRQEAVAPQRLLLLAQLLDRLCRPALLLWVLLAVPKVTPRRAKRGFEGLVRILLLKPVVHLRARVLHLDGVPQTGSV